MKIICTGIPSFLDHKYSELILMASQNFVSCDFSVSFRLQSFQCRTRGPYLLALRCKSIGCSLNQAIIRLLKVPYAGTLVGDTGLGHCGFQRMNSCVYYEFNA